MKIAVISDLHIGRGDVADPFGHEDEAFLRFLDGLEEDVERIVLLGDVWELLRGALPGRPLEELRLCREAHPAIARRFETPRYTYLHGNHDLAAAREGAPEELVLAANGTRLLFTHGHRHDWLVRNATRIAEASIWFGGWVSRVGLQPIVNVVDRIEQRTRGVSRDGAACSFQRWAVERARATAADVVVTGHTHLGAVTSHGANLFLNSGTCSAGRFQFLRIDTRASTFEAGSAP